MWVPSFKRRQIPARRDGKRPGFPTACGARYCTRRQRGTAACRPGRQTASRTCSRIRPAASRPPHSCSRAVMPPHRISRGERVRASCRCQSPSGGWACPSTQSKSDSRISGASALSFPQAWMNRYFPRAWIDLGSLAEHRQAKLPEQTGRIESAVEVVRHFEDRHVGQIDDLFHHGQRLPLVNLRPTRAWPPGGRR